MKIEILGPGCPNCTNLAKNAEQAAQELGLDYEIEKVTDTDQIVASGVMMTPGLVVDGEVKSTGKVASSEEIKGMLQ